ncbi:transcriptional regulator [Rahnella woolbedingensis]|uniref:Transcriptional regulator n=2 Tax=Rahnella woolbedingensis TaxID=1510574 RepID=A0A419N224_9GAMM|nr:transcriptional regulator [Rahnella woolbedingensis]
MLSQLTLRFPKKLIESLKNRAVTEKTSVNALAERFLDVSLQTSAPDDDWLQLTARPDEAVQQLYRKVVLGETFGRQALRRAELRFMMDLAHQAYRQAGAKEFVRWPVLETLLNISFELLVWQAEQGLPVDGHYIKRTFEFDSENWQEEAARFMQGVSRAVDPAYAELLLRPLVSGCFSLNDYPDDVLARIFTPPRLQQVFPLLMRTRQWSFEQRETFIREMRPAVREMKETFTAGDLRFDIRIEGQRGDLPAAVGDETPRLFLVLTGSNFVMPFGWAQFAELCRLLNVYRTTPEAVRRYSEGPHITLALPGAAHQDATLGFDALRVFVPAGAFGELVRELTARVETGALASAVEALRTLYGDL